jgi:polyisoprenoid-binding protein YceI
MDGMKAKYVYALAGAAILAVVVIVAGIWYFVLRDEAPPPVSLEAASTAVAANPQAGGGTTNLSGSWVVQGGGASFAGYRVNENLVGFGSKTAVGRSTGVQGSLSYDGSSISNLKVTVDMIGLKSDQSLRDDTLKMQAIQSCQFPTSTFELAAPLSIGNTPSDGTTVSKMVQGKLTLHGVTRDVSIETKGRLVNGQVVVVGSTKIAFADYGITSPRSFYVVSLDDNGIMEFQLIFAKGTPAAATPVPTTPAAIPGCSGGPPGGGPPGGGPPPGGGQPGGRPGGPPPGFEPPPLPTPAPVPSPVS